MQNPHSSSQGLPPPPQNLQSRSGTLPGHNASSPHQTHQAHPSAQVPYASPHPSTPSLPQQSHQSPYGPLPGNSGQATGEVQPYYQSHPSPYSANSTTGGYSSAEIPEHMATATMNARFPPAMYATPQSNSPASVQSPQHDQHGRPLYQPPSQMPQNMYYPSYSVGHQSSYGQHPGAQQHNPMTGNSMLMSHQPNQPMPQHSTQHSTGMTGSPKSRMSQTPLARPPSGLGAPQTAAPQTPVSAPGMHPGGPHSGAGINPNAAPGPIPATTPLVVRQDQNGVQWIAFEYSRDRVKMEYTIRCDVESVNTEDLPQEFKTENCVYPRACCAKDQYKGNRLHYETECNTVGWALAELNPCLRGKRGLIQRAVDSWRNSNRDPRLRSRRVRRMAKIQTRKLQQGSQNTAHLPGTSGPPGPTGPSGMPNTAGIPTGPPRPHSMGMGGPQLHHHHDHPGAPGGDDVSGNGYNNANNLHRNQNPSGQPSASPSMKHMQNFYPTYPTNASGMTTSGMPPIHDGMGHMSGHGPSQTNAVSASKRDNDERNLALFGDLPEAKRRKFILVEDSQRGTRVRVRVMLDQVQMSEIPDSYRKTNAVFPRSYFPVQTQSPPLSPTGSRLFADDPEDEDGEGGSSGAAPVTGRTLVSVPTLDGTDAKVPKPRLTRTKRNKEVTLNDLGYRMSWSQGRVFAGRTLFLQRSLDAYRNKMRSTMVSSGQDVTTTAPHFETRVGRRKWMERSKKMRRESSP